MSRLAHMFVISSSTAFTFKGKPIDTKRIGRELGVRYVLEGSVERSGDQARVNAQLINAETDAHLWAERFDRVTTDLFSLEDEITRRIAVALAVPEYEALIASDRNRANAYSGLGTCKLLTGSIDETISLEEEAIRLSPRDPYIGVTYWRIGVAHLLQSHTDEAIVWLEKGAVTLPWYPSHHAWLAAALALKGETERAAAELAEARRSKEGSYSSIARLRTLGRYRGSVPKIQALFEATYFAGLRKAGMPEE